MSAMAQGITTKAAYDDFMVASEFATEYSIKRDGFAAFPCTSLDTAYMGIFTYASKDDATIKLDVKRDTVNGELDLQVTQNKAAYEPFGFIFGSYCETAAEKSFGLDLSDNAMLSLVLSIDSVNRFEELVDGDPTGDAGIQIKIQAEDGNGKSIAFDKDYDPASPGDFWMHEIGITGDGGQSGNNFNNGSNYVSQGDVVTIQYDLKRGVVAGSDDKPDVDGVFYYSNVVALKITFSSNNKDKTDDKYDPYKLYTEVSIQTFQLGDVFGEGLGDAVGLTDGVEKLTTSLYPNPASSLVNFSEELENVSVYNTQGIQVYSASKANSVDVSSFESGVYFIKSSKGSSSFVVK